MRLDKSNNIATIQEENSSSGQGTGTGTGRKRGGGKRSKREMPAKAVQKLFDTCKAVFANGGATGDVPSPADVDRLRVLLDSMKPGDLGLNKDMRYFKPTESEGAPPIAYLHLYECNRFSMGIFCLPPNACIPLHNHPGMTVFSKLLFGSMHIKSYDWVADQPPVTSVQPPEIHLAKLKNNSVFTAPCKTSILYPKEGGNIHCFTAVTACAVLDVLGPPYSDPEGRHCTYYREFPYSSFSGDIALVPVEEGDGHAWLEEIEKAENFSVIGALYRGPRFMDR